MTRINKFTAGLIWLSTFLAGSGTIAAQESAGASADKPRKFAVLIGVSEYSHVRLRSLQYAAADARLLRNVLVQNCGYAESDTLLMTAGKDEKDRTMMLSLASLREQLPRFLAKVRPNDSILFFFAGHGDQKDGKGYLLPPECNLDAIEDTAIPISEIRSTLNASKANLKIMVLDACHSGAGANDTLGRDPAAEIPAVNAEELASQVAGFVRFTSCAANQIAYEWPEVSHGFFTYYFCEGLKGAADFDGNGEIECSELNKYVSKKVAEEVLAKKMVVQQPRYERGTDVTGEPVICIVQRNHSFARLKDLGQTERGKPAPKNLKVRIIKSGPKLDLGSGKFQAVKRDQIFTVVDKRNDWYRVVVEDGKYGWLYHADVTEE